jgi:hypothetical protein
VGFWREVNGHRYYLRSKRVAGRVVHENCGSGKFASLMAYLDLQDRIEREEQREQDRLDREEALALDEADRPVDQLIRKALAEAEAAIEAAGYRRHKRGDWRRRRERRRGKLEGAGTEPQAQAAGSEASPP